MGDRSLRGRGKVLYDSPTGKSRQQTPGVSQKSKARIGAKTSPVAKSRVIDRMKEEAKALGGSFFTAEEMEAKIKKMKKNG